MLVLPTLTKRLLNEKKENVNLYTGVFDAGKNIFFTLLLFLGPWISYL